MLGSVQCGCQLSPPVATVQIRGLALFDLRCELAVTMPIVADLWSLPMLFCRLEPHELRLALSGCDKLQPRGPA